MLVSRFLFMCVFLLRILQLSLSLEEWDQTNVHLSINEYIYEYQPRNRTYLRTNNN